MRMSFTKALNILEEVSMMDDSIWKPLPEPFKHE